MTTGWRPALVAWLPGVLSILGVLGVLGILAVSASAQVEVLTPDMVAKLAPAKERPLALTSAGDVARLVAGDGEWEEAAPPLILDLDRDGIRDFVVLSMVDARQLRRAIVIHDWGEAASEFGRAVFYVVLDSDDDVVEWGGAHRLAPRGGAQR